MEKKSEYFVDLGQWVVFGEEMIEYWHMVQDGDEL